MFFRNIIHFQQIIGRYVPEEGTLHNRSCYNLNPISLFLLNIQSRRNSNRS
jgi:hypothetical protein